MAKRRRRIKRRLVRLVLWAALLLVGSAAAYGLGVPPPLTPLMVIRALEGHGLERERAPLSALGRMPAAVIGSEDQRFCEHSGVDWIELKRVLDGERSGGASTITMQTIKNLYLWPSRGGGAADYLRKAVEIPAALLLDRAWGKARIMETYLNVIEFGPGVYGAQAAARHYYGVDAAQLSAAQATALAVLLPAPLERKPVAQSGRAVARTQDAAARSNCLAEP